jgi:hypothetical protein
MAYISPNGVLFNQIWRIISFWTYIDPLLGWGLMGHKKTPIAGGL